MKDIKRKKQVYINYHKFIAQIFAIIKKQKSENPYLGNKLQSLERNYRGQYRP